MSWGLILPLCALVLLAAVLRAAQAIRETRGTERGSDPGEGYHEIDANYASGGGGGGHQTIYRIPKDPQEYAKLFIPRKPKK